MKDSEVLKITQALYDLFQACSALPIEQMDRMEREINAAADALMDIPADLQVMEFPR